MSTVKTAISLDESLFKAMDVLAHQLRVSRSQVFVLAAQEFLRRQQNRQMLDKLNQVHAGELDRAEIELLDSARAYARQHLEGQW